MEGGDYCMKAIRNQSGEGQFLQQFAFIFEKGKLGNT
jgi:hypothetical protein